MVSFFKIQIFKENRRTKEIFQQNQGSKRQIN